MLSSKDSISSLGWNCGHNLHYPTSAASAGAGVIAYSLIFATRDLTEREMRKLFILAVLLPMSVGAGVCTNLPPVPLGNGQTYVVWNSETPTAGNGTTAASQQVSISTGNNEGLRLSL